MYSAALLHKRLNNPPRVKCGAGHQGRFSTYLTPPRFRQRLFFSQTAKASTKARSGQSTNASRAVSMALQKGTHTPSELEDFWRE